MLYIIAADDKSFRGTVIGEIAAQFSESEIISVDDTTISPLELEQFLYPSLFEPTVPIVHAKFLFGGEAFGIQFLKKFAASPTVFIFEEFALPAGIVAMFKKAGATVHIGTKEKTTKKTSDAFAVTACVTAQDKKARWLAYRAGVQDQAIEAVLGILYWKLRMLAAGGKPGNRYETLYREFLSAQARAWQTGAPLEALIEKVILSY